MIQPFLNEARKTQFERKNNMNLSEYMLYWCEKNYPDDAERIYYNMIDVAAGNREGTEFEQSAVEKAFAEYENYKQSKNLLH